MLDHFKTAALAATLIATAPLALAARAQTWTFGNLPDGRAVPAVTLTNKAGVSATVIAYGATLQSLIMPDKVGERADITLGYATIDDYLATPQYFGATVGRVANRIAKGRFTLDGKSYQAGINNVPNSLHGGTVGFDKLLWKIIETKADASGAHVTLRLVSPDGDQGYPGTLTVTATYTLDESNALTIEYRATTDRTTVVNISNHAYWNLGGEPSSRSAMGHVLTIPAESYLPVDTTLIPTGEFRPVADTVFDFRTGKAIGDHVRDATDEQIIFGRGYDHNWVIGRAVTDDMHLMAKVVDPVSGRNFELWSNQPGLQFYSGNFLNETSYGKAKCIYREGDAIALEPQTFPDTVNQPVLGSVRLDPRQIYRNVIVYKLRTGAEPKR